MRTCQRGELTLTTRSIGPDFAATARPALLAGLCWLLAASLAACAQQSPRLATDADGQRAWVLGGAGELDATTEAPIDRSELFALSDNMREFAQRATATAKDDGEKIRLLVDSLHSDRGLALRYDAAATLTPQQAFEQRRANCLTHTLLFIAMARTVGIDARFNHVDIPPLWDLRGDNLVLYRHINARIGQSSERFRIVDLTPEEYDPAYHQWIISDTEAAAQFFGNRAMDLLVQQRRPLALRYQLRAIELAPNASFLWSNLGRLYLDLGNARAAEVSIRIALQLDPDSLSAYGTATRIYESLGEHAQARAFRLQAEKLQRRNPYYHYQLAERAFAGNRLPNALDEVKTAISLYPQDHRFFLLLGAVLNRLDQPQLARKSIEAAISLSVDETQQARYRSKLERIPVAAQQAPG